MAVSAKYGRVTVEHEPGEPLGEDEPVFLIRARDVIAVEGILRYRDAYEAEVLRRQHPDPHEHYVNVLDNEMTRGLREDAGRFEGWQAEHPDLVKVPD